MISQSLFLFAMAWTLVTASYEATCSNNEYYPLYSGLLDQWSYVPPSDRNYTADWTFHPQSFTINLHLTATSAPLTDPDLLVGISTRNGSRMFRTALSPLMPRAALLGNSFDKTWFLGRLRADSSVWGLQAVQSQTGKLLETISPVPAPDNAPIACFHNELLYVVSGSTVSLFYYNHTTRVMRNVWTRQNMPMRAPDATACNIESDGGYLFYYSESEDKTKSINLVSKGGRLAWGVPPPNRLSDFKSLVYTPASSRTNRTIYLAGLSDGTYYAVDYLYGTSKEIVIDPEFQSISQRDRFRYSKMKHEKSIDLNFLRSSPFVISASELALSVDRSFWTDQQTLFALKDGKLAWKVHLTGANNTYQIIIDDDKHRVYVMKVAVEDDGEKGFVFALDGTFVQPLPPEYSGQNATLFRDAAFFLQYQKLPNGVLGPRIIGLKRNELVV